MLTLALISISFVLPHALADCSTPPIYVDLRARAVEGTASLSYGASISLGTPAQPLSLWPSLNINETTVADSSFCSRTQCSASEAHGTFDHTKSKSWTTTPSTDLDNTTILTANSLSSISASGSDTLRISESFFADESSAVQLNFTSFPIELLTNYTASTSPFFGPGGLAGLGPSSTLLDQLFSAGKIASRSFGLYLGSAFNEAASVAGGSANGSLTLGGYDGARFDNDVNSFPIAHASDATSPFQVSITNILSQNTSNTGEELMANQTPFTAYLSTSQYAITLPSSLQAAFQGTTGAKNPPTTVQIVLNHNLTISLNASLVLTTVQFSPQGPYILGASFLSSVYLTASYDSNPPTFFLAQARPSAAFVSTQPLCANGRPVESADPHLSFFVKNGLIGLIVGATILGLALSVLGFMLLRRYCAKKRTRIVRFGDVKSRHRDDDQDRDSEELEMGYMNTNPSRRDDVLDTKPARFNVVEKMKGKNDRNQNRGTTYEEEEQYQSAGMGNDTTYFEPPPTRESVVPGRKANKMRLKGILKVRVPSDNGRG